MSRVVASKRFEGVDELIEALEILRDRTPDQYAGVEGDFAITGHCVLLDEGDDIWVIRITDKSSDEIEAAEVTA